MINGCRSNSESFAFPINESIAGNFGAPQTLTEEGELVFEKGMASGVATSLVSKEIEHTPIDFVGVVAQSVGSSLGQAFAMSMPLPTAPAQSSTNQSNSASSKNPGQNRFGMFANSGNSNPTDSSNNSDLIWTTDSNGNPIQVEQRNPFPRLDGINSNTMDPNNSLQEIKNGFWEGIGFINGVGDALTYPFKHPINLIEGFGETLLNAGKIAIGVDFNGSALQYFQNMGDGLINLYNQTSSIDPNVRGYAWGTMFAMGAGVGLQPEGISFVGDLGEIGFGVTGKYIGLSVPTSRGYAFQSFSADALVARYIAGNGAPLYRAGTIGMNATYDAQYWSLENPASAINYAENYGIPSQNTRFNFFESGALNQNSNFITRYSPGVGSNLGGGIEVVTEPEGVRLNYWNMF